MAGGLTNCAFSAIFEEYPSLVMTNETNYHQPEGLRESFRNSFEKEKGTLERYAIATLVCLIASVILLIFSLRLPAGMLVIASAAMGVVVARKSMNLMRIMSESFDEASQMSGKKDEVIISFSHRIREHLNNIVIIADLLSKSGFQNKQQDLVETLIASTNNMVSGANELSMKSAGNLNPGAGKKIRFNIVSTIENTIELYSLKDSAGIDFILNNRETEQFEVIGNPIVVKQIFLDLFSAVEGNTDGSIARITINLNKVSEGEKESIVSFRVQTDRKIELIDEENSYESLATKLIASMNGNYRFEHTNGITILEFTLPFISLPPDSRRQQSGKSVAEAVSRIEKKKVLREANILLVEDNSINQKITILTLKSLVSNIDTAVNGMEALEMFGNSSYDLILMDIKMPVMSGLEAAEKIRAMEENTNEHVPIIAITANAMLGDKERCLASGMDDYISKPFHPSALIEKIKKFI